jgi:hypothetical protein
VTGVASDRFASRDIVRLVPVRQYLEREVLADIGKHHVIDEADARGGPFDVEQDATDCGSRVGTRRVHKRSEMHQG